MTAPLPPSCIGFPNAQKFHPFLRESYCYCLEERAANLFRSAQQTIKGTFIYDRPITVKSIIMFSLFASNCVSTCLFVYSFMLTQYRCTNSQQHCQGLKLQSTVLHFRRMAGFSPVAVCTSLISN